MQSLLRKTLWCFIFCIGLWLAGLFWFLGQIPATTPKADNRVADTIVVLTGGKGRLERGLQLLAEGKGRSLFISGVNDMASTQDLLNRADPKTRSALSRIPSSAIVLGRDAYNTIGNAEETARWIAGKNIRTIRLVTSCYHMPRSISEFKEVLPDITIWPEPVFTRESALEGWCSLNQSGAHLLPEYHKFLAGKLRQWIMSRTQQQ